MHRHDGSSYLETKQRLVDKTPGYTVSSSIPTKYQRVVITNEEKKGFSSQAKRFSSHICLNENPGPGSYSCTTSTEAQSPSFSKKGTTGFVASRVTCGSRERLNAVVGTSGFLSKTGRNTFYPNGNMPSPCHYEVKNHFIQHSSKAVLSPFKSKTQRIPALVDNHVPGPGAYSPHQTRIPAKKTMLPRGYYLAISAPALIVPKDPPLPGPGQYDLVRKDSSSKHPLPTAAFASTTERKPQICQTDANPGPGFYNPRVWTKQSFFYNDSKVWIPA
ncbi:O(6)-methylguanine-induced apoptosis 2 isoform X3 [Betta splendens]|uniref:O(6)-methylguanine-induced apoptosis 2 isoform X3 n=1 Tax=Betta splendens TaxID=158456 RepID=A0A9W2Y484_BETSP|nr:O(6)-methylguanine-induced apoptosis 2 isoform X3 [Betta splendens]